LTFYSIVLDVDRSKIHRASSPPWALVNAAMAGVDNVEIKAMASRTLSMMVLHDVNGFQITSFNPSDYLCD
jgi:hypothetical protein